MSTSTVASGVAARTAAMAAANCAAPPSGRSSRVTLVMTTCRRPSRRAASRDPARLVLVEGADAGGARPCPAASPASPAGAAFPSPSTAQKRHARVHTSPRIRNVAVPEA